MNQRRGRSNLLGGPIGPASVLSAKRRNLRRDTMRNGARSDEIASRPPKDARTHRFTLSRSPKGARTQRFADATDLHVLDLVVVLFPQRHLLFVHAFQLRRALERPLQIALRLV